MRGCLSEDLVRLCVETEKHSKIMPQFIYTMKGLGKVYPPDSQVLKDIWLSFLPGAKIGVLGLNGSGKSTLLKIMAGVDHDFGGEAFPADGITTGYLPAGAAARSVEDREGHRRGRRRRDRARLLQRFDEINEKFAQDLSPDEMDKVLAEQARVQDKIDAAGAWELDSKLELAMDALRLPPPDVEVKTLSGGERRRVALCRLLLQSPDLLLLDEPTNHLDAESVAWLERFLKDYQGTVVAVTHDRYFLDNVAGWILELDRGSGIPWEGNYSSWLEQKQKRLQLEEKTESKRQRTLARELEWVRMAPRARQAKGKARLKAYEELLGQDTAKQIENVEIYIQPGPRLGDVVVEARDLRKAYGDKLLIDDLNFTLPRGGIVGVIGPNGAGKTTLFRMMTGQEKPDDGTLRLGETVKLGYVDQSRDSLSPNKTVHDEISGGEEEITLGKRTVAVARVRVVVQLQGARPAAARRRAVGRRAQPRAPGEAAARRQQRAAARRADERSRRRHAARARRGACCSLRAASSSSATIAGSSTASRRTCWRSRARARWSGSRGTTRTTRPTGTAGWAPPPTSRIGSSTGS